MIDRPPRKRLLPLALAAVLAGAPLAAAAADPVELNVVLPLTGPVAFAGKLESDSLRVLEDYVDEHGGIRGRSVKIVLLDDQTVPQNTVQFVTGLVAKKVPVFAGSSLAAMCNAYAPLVKDGPVAYCFSPSIRPAAGGFLFSGDFSSDDCIKVAVRYFQARGLRRIATINPTDATGQDADRAIDEVLQSHAYPNVSFVAREHFNPTDITVRAQIARIKASGAQAVISYTTGTAVATVLHGMSEEGLDIPILASPGSMAAAQLAQYKSFMPSQLLFPGHAWLTPEYVTDRTWKATIQRYTDAMTAAGVKPDKIGAGAWDIATMIVEALRRVGPDAPAEQVRAALAGLRGWSGVLGRYDFVAVPQRGLTPDSIPIDRWDPDKTDFVAASKPGGDPIH